jgi:NAD(P)H dehydrogenase (quinone)
MITVTGATGKLGRLVIDGLLDRIPAEQITAAVRSPETAADLAARGVEVRRADYDEPGTLLASLAGTDRLLLISGNDPRRTLAQHTAVIDAAKQIGVSLLAYTSLVLPTAPPRSTEPVIEASGLPFTMLRNAQYSGHYAPQITQAVATGVFVGSAGAGRTATASHADLAAAAVTVLTGEGHEDKVYELTGDEAWSFPELVAEIGRASGRTVSYRNVSFAEHLELLLGAGVPRPYAEVYVANYQAIAAGGFAKTTADLRELIGRPATTLAEFVAEVVNSPAPNGGSAHE